MISIIIPIYNVEQYLSQCIESIITQTYTDFEVLLINDGSTDKSGEICDNYALKDSRIHVFHKKNGGVSSARNVGIEHATGEWINFIDSDDWISADYFEKLMQDTEIADLTFWGFTLHNPDGSQTEYKPKEQYACGKDKIESTLAYLKQNQQQLEYLGYTFNKLFKTSIIKEKNIRFIENLSIREDEIFTLSYASHINSVKVKSSLSYNYRILHSSLTHRKKPANEYLCLIEQLNKVLHPYSNTQLLLAEQNSILIHLFNALIADKPFAKSWFKLLNQFITKGQFLNQQKNITNKKMNLLFKYNCKLYQYIITISYCLSNK